MENCKYLEDKKCLLCLEKCKESKYTNCKIYNNVLKEKPSEQIYTIREDVTCKKCGFHFAYRYEGRLFPSGLSSKEIDKCPKIYGKYYNKTHLFSAVGFGGTIPYKCAGCNRIGLINMSLECYEDLFDENLEN